MYVLLKTCMGLKVYAMVFSSHEDALRCMTDDFNAYVRHEGLEIEDGYCFITDWGAYDTPDGSGVEWRIYSAEDRTS